MIQGINPSVNPLPQTLSELAVLVYCLAKVKVPRWRVAADVGVSLRTVAYKVNLLQTRGLLTVTRQWGKPPHPYDPSQGHYCRRWQRRNSYSAGPTIAPLDPDVLSSLLYSSYREAMKHDRTRGAITREDRMWGLLDVLLVLSRRLRAKPWALLVASYRYLRQFGNVGMIEALEDMHAELQRSDLCNTYHPPGLLVDWLQRRLVAEALDSL